MDPRATGLFLKNTKQRIIVMLALFLTTALIWWTRPNTQEAALGRLELDPNVATAGQLETLPGLGKTLSQRIVEHRQQAGPFKNLEQLRNIKGMTMGRFNKCRAHLTINSKTRR